ncbi:hypothetical protein [Pelotomaculum propionicicum]|uniref:Uncharacterized protein n=1 Tax=Pelotomaculum propionicicum TaxID=258475 RepID=A0A4Y7RXG4_9FIRM|nr:hypothetical protein [Pelotomaculum propionicicum]TEB13409.1 hypothetical protein Pmgp_00303 [Pelotomaculum propionicicum]
MFDKVFQDQLVAQISEALRTAARQVLDEIHIDGSISRVQSYPEAIRRQQNILVQAQRNLDKAKQSLDLAKAEIIADINAAVNGQGKPLFSNEKARETEFIRRAREDENYRQALAEARRAEDECNDAKFMLDQLYNEFTAARAVLAAKTAKVNLMAGIMA